MEAISPNCQLFKRSNDRRRCTALQRNAGRHVFRRIRDCDVHGPQNESCPRCALSGTALDSDESVDVSIRYYARRRKGFLSRRPRYLDY